MKVIICGGRNWDDDKPIRRELLNLPSDTLVIQGEAYGADTIAKNIALEIGLEVVGWPAAWHKYGKSAGMKRNLRMLDMKPDLVLAFHRDIKNSKGTKNMVNIAKKENIEVRIITR